ncbi:hypothetical protein [Methylococcus sp. EFPC2]|uniref:hypothetical protein n=1 Tax=Methylococcus sp. EFPC2 TaxID=2812648 RepID=UPI00196702DA|nr:hypothetical protein [Methylococcus sp. EFPC2]QSA96361.1 hypothetical protein JWZ97_14210 [Methylococcus sp. EFPC2]
MPTLADVAQAMQAVQNQWGAYIPAHLKNYKADQITILANEQQWGTAFRFIYDVVFKPANQFNQEAGDFIDGVLGFVTPTFSHTKRKIYISPKVQGYTRAQQLMVLSHEYIHWLSHESFYPSYYMVGGHHPFQVEGATQWLTVACGYQLEFQTLPAYLSEYLKTNAWISADKGNLPRLLAYLFNGVRTDLSSIHP